MIELNIVNFITIGIIAVIAIVAIRLAAKTAGKSAPV
jgi:hypothetical protein